MKHAEKYDPAEIKKTLKAHKGVKLHALKDLGISRSTLWRRLKRMGEK
jgi:transcriptional regulator of acetoin/glycerol metabolism